MSRKRAARPRPTESRQSGRTLTSSSSGQRHPAWLLAALLLVTLAAYYPAWHGGPLWDDDAHLTSPELQSAEGLRRIWLDVGATQQYYPVAHSAFWVMNRLWGHETLGYHLVNIALHACSAFLIGLILRRLAVPGAWLAAFLFALHPVHVESVAWMTELKNTLSGVFYLVAALAYLKFDTTRTRPPYIVAVVLFVLALLTKTVTASLPMALLVVFWWQRGRLRWREDLLPLLPLIGIGAAAGLTTAWLERTQIGAEGVEFDLSIVERSLIAGRAIWFYLSKLIWPLNLTFIYPRWDVNGAVWWQYLYPLGIVVLLAALWRFRTRSRAPLAAALIFIGTLFPALGFLNVYPFVYSFVADHFQYLASMSIIALFAAVIARSFHRSPQKDLRDLRVLRGETVIAFTAIVALGVLTWRQCQQYVDAETLFRTTLARNEASWMVHHNLGWVLLGRGQGTQNRALVEEAVPHFNRALELKSDFSQVHNNLGTALLELGRLDEAKAKYETALRLKPDDAEVHYNLGLVLERLGRPEESMTATRAALKIRPDYAEAQASLGNALQSIGRLDEALAAYREALRLNPSDSEAHHNLGTALGRLGRTDEATSEFREALRLKPDSVRASRSLGQALMRLGRYEEAVTRFRDAVRLAPDYAAAHLDLGNALVAVGRPEEAIAELRRTIQLQPGFAPAHNDLGIVLAELGRLDEAIAAFTEAVKLAPEFADAKANLARAINMKRGKGM
jgi:protein O-mannosyl-transferase